MRNSNPRTKDPIISSGSVWFFAHCHEREIKLICSAHVQYWLCHNSASRTNITLPQAASWLRLLSSTRLLENSGKRTKILLGFTRVDLSICMETLGCQRCIYILMLGRDGRQGHLIQFPSRKDSLTAEPVDWDLKPGETFRPRSDFSRVRSRSIPLFVLRYTLLWRHLKRVLQASTENCLSVPCDCKVRPVRTYHNIELEYFVSKLHKFYFKSKQNILDQYWTQYKVSKSMFKWTFSGRPI